MCFFPLKIFYNNNIHKGFILTQTNLHPPTNRSIHQTNLCATRPQVMDVQCGSHHQILLDEGTNSIGTVQEFGKIMSYTWV